jgi:hypothetical protein
VSDKVSGGLHGIRLPENGIAGIEAKELALYYESSGSSGPTQCEKESGTMDSLRQREIFRRVCVNLAARLLSLLDVFIFPDSLDAALPASQLHGLALVRSTETRIGGAQGPLLASLVRLSLVLLCHLEPCSVKLLQCSSRLRCFLHWMMELIRESQALDGYSQAFNDLTAPLDRLILAIVLQCHRALGRCGALLSEIESSSSEKYFESKESQKKYTRRLLRVVLELRDIILTAYKGRNEVLRASLSRSAFEALQSCLGVTSQSSDEQAPLSSNKPASHREMIIRNLLTSDWVTKLQDVDVRENFTIPEQVESGNEKQDQSLGVQAVEELSRESKAIINNLEKSLNSCFEKYLEAQRKWAETGAVRDLEFEGDTTLKRLSGKHKSDMSEFGKLISLRSAAAESRWRGIHRRFVQVWERGIHWKLARYSDLLGRRILLVQNRNFSDHEEASYELLMGLDREKEEKGKEERLRKKQELAELMKRNTEAFVPYGGDNLDAEDEEREQETDAESDQEEMMDGPEGESTEKGVDTTVEGSIPEGLDEEKVDDGDAGSKIDLDAWAKAFIWSDNESVVARFDSVMIVTLQYLIEGKLLLTTHGLYFHQTGEETNVMTNERIETSDGSRLSILEMNDRRWQLSRVTEVLGRRFMLRAQALELFFSDSHELFINFLDGTKERDRFYAKLRNSCKVGLHVSVCSPPPPARNLMVLDFCSMPFVFNRYP